MTALGAAFAWRTRPWSTWRLHVACFLHVKFAKIENNHPHLQYVHKFYVDKLEEVHPFDTSLLSTSKIMLIKLKSS